MNQNHRSNHDGDCGNHTDSDARSDSFSDNYDTDLHSDPHNPDEDKVFADGMVSADMVLKDMSEVYKVSGSDFPDNDNDFCHSRKSLLNSHEFSLLPYRNQIEKKNSRMVSHYA